MQIGNQKSTDYRTRTYLDITSCCQITTKTRVGILIRAKSRSKLDRIFRDERLSVRFLIRSFVVCAFIYHVSV